MNIINSYLEKYNKEYVYVLENSFIKEERRKTSDWLSLLKEGKQSVLTILNSHQKFIGFLTYWTLEHSIYIEHFAIKDSERSKGVGSLVIDYIHQLFKNKTIILEVEPLGTSPLADKRIQFYLNHKFYLLNYRYKQPPYYHGGTSIKLSLMSNKQENRISNLHEIISEIKQKVYSSYRY